ncbi:hypothetical protein [Selenomonas sp.]|nr:hypothetical protein [Selenomonas sp.]MCI6282929.1 hypothetical protein [Selenomonas sp.]
MEAPPSLEVAVRVLLPLEVTMRVLPSLEAITKACRMMGAAGCILQNGGE